LARLYALGVSTKIGGMYQFLALRDVFLAVFMAPCGSGAVSREIAVQTQNCNVFFGTMGELQFYATSSLTSGFLRRSSLWPVKPTGVFEAESEEKISMEIVRQF